MPPTPNAPFKALMMRWHAHGPHMVEVLEPRQHVAALVRADSMDFLGHSVDLLLWLVDPNSTLGRSLLHGLGNLFAIVLDVGARLGTHDQDLPSRRQCIWQ